ncbi:MmcQ/YjbR family DNA-binding protein [Clostridium estertheticum]|uniref:MmcQ/YjbR family DNA-binding protein n=1 Tax=Clostridium estertheticum TaxID=238834 RepID=UPI001CF19B2F|nr:MmcQ/YjbR family DNA-binding protein [Clostridium estertheticum]MCB2360931.1 MmcQ/YjbR family DNA-binding protein [Clostridium estertheticum]
MLISRTEIFQYANKKYGTKPDYPRMKLPGYAVLRHSDNTKWYGLISNVSRKKLQLDGDEIVDILNVKCDPILIGSLRIQDGFLPAYHMNRLNWISILLDGSVDIDTIYFLLDMSFELTLNSKKLGRSQAGANTEWIVPANPKYFDLDKAFMDNDVILWKQSNNIAVGDIVYMYVAAPYSSIKYKCKVVEVNIPYNYNDDKVSMNRVMKIKLLTKYDSYSINLALLREHGVYAVRGPRSIPISLINEIETLYK